MAGNNFPHSPLSQSWASYITDIQKSIMCVIDIVHDDQYSVICNKDKLQHKDADENCKS